MWVSLRIVWIEWCPFLDELTFIEIKLCQMWVSLIGSKTKLSKIYCPRRTKFVRGLWNGLRTCVCPSVCPSVRAQNVKVCFFSVISWPILILFVLSDRAWCGLQNFYTEFWNSDYANLCKFIQNQTWKMLLLCHFLADFRENSVCFIW